MFPCVSVSTCVHAVALITGRWMLGAPFCNRELLTHPFQNLAALVPPVEPVFLLDFCSLPGNHTVKTGSNPMSVAELHSKGYSAKALASMEANNTIDHKLWQWEIEEGVNHRYALLVTQTQTYAHLSIANPACLRIS